MSSVPHLEVSRLICKLNLHLADGRYALIECKLGSKEIEDGASHLVELKRLFREHNKKDFGMKSHNNLVLV